MLTGRAGTVWLKFSQASKAGLAPDPVGRPVFDTTTAANRSGNAATRRRPIRPPQSWQKRVMSVRSMATSQALIQATWASKV